MLHEVAPVAFVAVMLGVLAAGLWKYLKEQQKKKEDKVQDDDGVLRIYLSPEAEEVDIPALSDHSAVSLRGFNLLPAYVNRRYCELFVDSGTSSALMKYRRAEHLGLLSRAKDARLMKVKMWARQTQAKMLVVNAVSVELPGGVSFPCTFLVAPKHGPINYLKNDIFLDNRTLRRTQAIQCFSPTSSTLFFPNPVPQWRPRTSPDSQFVLDHARLDSSSKAQTLNVHLDTGAKYFYASKKYHRPETPVEIVAAKDSVIRWEALAPAPATTFDFILGARFLASYNSVLDFASEHLYLRIGDRMFRTKLKRTWTL